MNTKNAGLTLIELIVVLACLGITFSAAVLSFSNADKQKLESALTGLQSDLRYIRKLSLNESVKTRVVFDYSLNGYKVQKDGESDYVTIKTVELKDVKLDSVNTDALTVEYTSRGTTGDACTVGMSAGGFEGSLTVNVGSGRVRIKEITKKKRL